MANGKRVAPDETEDLGQEVKGGELVEGMSSLERAEIDVRIATARRYPRSISRWKVEAMEMATLDEETAGSCFYILPRAGKRIEGPSVRLAEIAISCWGNAEFGARGVEVGDKTVTGEGLCFDLEKNTKAVWRVTRRITDKYGKRFNDDMVNTTMLAAQAIAFRQAVFKVVPQALIKAIYDEAKKVSIGKALTLEKQREKAIEGFKKLGIGPELVVKIAEVQGLEDIGVDELITLRGVWTAIHDGDTTVEALLRELMPPPPTPGAPGSKLSQVAAEKAQELRKEGNGHAEAGGGEAGSDAPGEAEPGRAGAETAPAGQAAGAGDQASAPSGASGGQVHPADSELVTLQRQEIADFVLKLKLVPEGWDYMCQTHLGEHTIDTAPSARIKTLRDALAKAWADVQGKNRGRR